MNRAELLDAILEARADWDAQVSAVEMTRYEEPGVCGPWSLKDLIAHITWYEREIVQMLAARSYTDASPWWALPDDPRNENIYTANRNRALADVLDDARATYDALLAQIETLSDDDLNDAARFEDSPPDAEPWEIIAQNTYEHYQHHAHDVEAWLESSA